MHEDVLSKASFEQGAIDLDPAHRIGPPLTGRCTSTTGLLAFWDWFSLVFSLHSLSELDDGVPMPYLPLNYAGHEAPATATHVGGGRVRLTPYPFVRDLLPCILPARTIPNRRYPNDAALQEALAAAPLEAAAFTLTAG